MVSNCRMGPGKWAGKGMENVPGGGGGSNRLCVL